MVPVSGLRPQCFFSSRHSRTDNGYHSQASRRITARIHSDHSSSSAAVCPLHPAGAEAAGAGAQRAPRTHRGCGIEVQVDIAAAEAKTQDYEQRLREARAVIYKAQEARRQQAQQARAEALAQARARAQEQIRQARAAIEQDMAAARGGLQAEVDKLAAEIIRTVLRPAGTATAIGGQP